MKRPSAASQKRVNTDNLVRLGPERLAALLLDFAEGRADLKRRLRMELAAEAGGEHLAAEVDKRLTALETSRTRVSWRGRAAFVRDLEALRRLIVERLAELDQAAALDRAWRLVALAEPLARRVSDKNGELDVIFDQAAWDLGVLIASGGNLETPTRLVEAVVRAPNRWGRWLPAVVEGAPVAVLAAALAGLRDRPPSPSLTQVIRQLADATGDIDVFRSTFAPVALKTPSIAAEIAARLLTAGRAAEAGAALETGRPAAKTEIDFAWETAWIDYLEATGQARPAQTARWASFERTLSSERARAFVKRLDGFDDVEAEQKAFAIAGAHPNALAALRFLMDWPAPADAARLIKTRIEEINAPQDEVELWAGKLRLRQPAAAHALLRRAASRAFRRRDFATADRLTAEADAIDLP